MRPLRCFYVWLAVLLLSSGLGLSSLAVAQLTTVPNSLADSLAKRRALAPDTARLRLLLADANALRSEAPQLAGQLAAQARALAVSTHQPPQEVKALLLLGRLANNQGNSPEAARHALQALRLAELQHDTLAQASACTTLGTANKNLHQYAEALTYAHRAQSLLAPLARAGQTAAGKALAVSLNNSGAALLDQKQFATAQADFRASLRQSRAIGDSGVAVLALYNLGALALHQHQSAAAYQYFRQTLAIDEAGQNVQGQAESWLNMGDALAQLHRPAEAEAAYRRALQLGRQVQALPLLRVVYNGFAALYEDTGRPALALAWQKRFQALNDSLFEEQSAQQVTEMQTKYETEKKDAQNRLQAVKLREQQRVIRQRNIQLGGVVALSALLGCLAYLLYTRHRLRQQVAHAVALQQLQHQRMAAVLEAEETERRRIGADLHDGVGQLLSVVKLNVNSLCEDLRPGLAEDHRQRFSDTLDLVDESVREVRGISHNLLPNALIKRGLALAVREFLEKIQRPGHLRVHLETLGLDDARLDKNVESALYRVIQELAQNIVKHAQATQMDLQLIRHDDELTLLMEDNGVGFDPDSLNPDAGIVLRNMKSRVAFRGGSLHLDSRPGRGTAVTATIPLEKK